MNNAQIEKMKRRLGISLSDTVQDALLEDILEDAQSAFKVYTGADTVDVRFEFIVLDVAMKLYNRKGSEGMTSESVDGYQATYAVGLMDEYADMLVKHFPQLQDADLERRGRVVVW